MQQRKIELNKILWLTKQISPLTEKILDRRNKEEFN